MLGGIFMLSEQTKLPVAAPEPYPPLEVARPNLLYARFLAEDIAAAKGEMTAIYQYLYQGWILAAEHYEIVSALHQIAEVEMRHLDMLGKLVIKLGGNPKCRSAANDPQTAWNGNMVDYHPDLKQILAYNAALESDACRTYHLQSKMVRDPRLSAILARISMDENLHMQIFENLLHQFS